MDLIALRIALYAALFAQFGIAAFGIYALKPSERGGRIPFRYARVLPPLAFLALVFGVLGIVAHLASMAGTGWWPVNREMLGAMLGGTDLGVAWVVRLAAPILALAGSMVFRRSATPLLAVHLVSSSVAIATLVWSGHAGATEDYRGTIHRSGDTLHMLAAAVWFGGLLSFTALLSSRDIATDPARIALATRTLDQFSRVGMIAVAVIVVTGLFNSAMTFGLGNLARLDRAYAALLTFKLLLFAAMLGCAAFNRWHLTPALKSGDAADVTLSALRRTIMLETLAGVLLFAAVAWLGTLDPIANVSI